jgi:ribosomal protein S27AE
MAEAKCPSCGAPIVFKIGASMSQVCGSCKSVVVRSDRGLENLGRVADVVTSDRGLAVHDRGNFRGRNYEVMGKVTLAHPAGGSWDEYYVTFDGRDPGWISEAQGRWSVVSRVQATAPHPSQLQVQAQVPLGTYGTFVVTEIGQGTFHSADGELPFAARPGTLRKFADLSGPNGMCAQIDYGDGATAPLVHVGYEVELAELNVQRTGYGARGEKVKAKDTKCPSCGGPLPLASAQSERIACKYCGALSDLETNQVIARQGQARQEPWIPLGAKGVLENVEWMCIGYMHRSTQIDGESFSWSEYLLYNEQHGYRWLVLDEGVVRFGSNLPAGQVDIRGLPTMVSVRGANYRKRNGNSATVDYVLGEFYWKVALQETVWAEDFENGRYMVSSERAQSGTQNEMNWTFSQTIPRDVVEAAFGIRGRTGAFGDPGQAPAYQGGAATGMSGLVVAIIVIFVLLMFIGACSAACSGGSGSSGGYSSGGTTYSGGGGGVRIGGGSSGGFGGK